VTPEDPSRVVVLGATGFLGADLVQVLHAAGATVVGLGSREVDLRASDAAARLQAVLRPDDALVFASALTPDRGRDVGTFMQNLVMAEQVAATLTKAPCAHVVYVSSDAVYDDTDATVTEVTCASPSTLYGAMHFARERVLRHTLDAVARPLLLVRPSLLYGPGDTHNAYGPNRFVRSAERERTIALFGAGEERRDHVWVRDVSRLIVLALRHRSEGTLNAATGRSVSFRDVAAAVAARMPNPVRIEERPRSGPIVHREFDAAVTAAAFPGFRYTPFAEGFAAAWEERGGRDGW
jgi:nucleoside-diphosphate-sugar epimerase